MADNTPEYTDNNEGYRDYDAMVNALQDANIDPEKFEVHPHARQPDGDLVEEKASGVQTSISASLGVDETVTTEFFDTDGWETIEVLIVSDVKSANNGLKAEYTDNVQGAQEIKATDLDAHTVQDASTGHSIHKFPTLLDGARISYTNNGETATDLDVIVTLRDEPDPDTAQHIDTNSVGEEFVRIGSSTESDGIKIGSPTSLFGDLNTIERTTVIDATSSFGTSILRDEIFTTGSGSITQDPDPATGEIELSTGTTADSSIQLRTAEYGRYTPGFSAQAGMGIRIETLPTEGELRWGYFDDNNGFYFGYDPTNTGELFVARRENGTEVERVTQSNFNGFDPEQVYNRDFQLDEGNIFQIDFSWYGYGIVNFSVVSQTDETGDPNTPRQETVTLHSFAVRSSTSTSDPNQPISIEAENGSTGEDVSIRVGGRQFSVFGELPTKGRLTSETNLSETIADGSWTHVMSWRRRINGPDLDANARLDVEDLDFTIDQTAKLALVVNADVTTNNFSLPELTPDNETELEVTTNETFNGIGNGTKVWGASIKVEGTGNAVPTDIGNVQVDVGFGQNNTVSLIAQCDGGSGESTSTMRLLEDY